MDWIQTTNYTIRVVTDKSTANNQEVAQQTLSVKMTPYGQKTIPPENKSISDLYSLIRAARTVDTKLHTLSHIFSRTISFAMGLGGHRLR